MDQVKKWIQTEFQKPGNVFLGLIHRLDRNVSGVVLFARTSKGASRLSKQFREKTTQKIYRAIVEGKPNPEQTTLSHHLRKEKSLKSTVFQRSGKDTQHAELEYKTLENYPELQSSGSKTIYRKVSPNTCTTCLHRPPYFRRQKIRCCHNPTR